jgi:hypothetical protein
MAVFLLIVPNLSTLRVLITSHPLIPKNDSAFLLVNFVQDQLSYTKSTLKNHSFSYTFVKSRQIVTEGNTRLHVNRLGLAPLAIRCEI